VNLKTSFQKIGPHKWRIPKTEKLRLAIKSFGLAEKLVFYTFFGLFALSALLLLNEVNNAFMVEIPAKGGTLEEGVVGYPRYINPVLAINDSGRDLTQLIYSGLMKRTASGELVPDLAESYSVSPDGLTYDFILRKDATFQDGVAVTADDVQFTVLKVEDPTIKSPREANWQGVTVQVINPKEIKFTLKKPYGPFLQNTTLGILPKHLWNEAGDADSFTLSDLNRTPIGSGPYMIKSIKTDSSGLPEYYHLVPFKNYAGGAPFIKDIIVRIYTNQNNLLTAFNNNEVQDINSISPDQAAYIHSGKTAIATSTLPRVFGIFFNQSQNPVLLHQEVRKALSLSVDREEIVKEVFNGYAEPLTEPIPTSLLPAATSSTSDSASSSVSSGGLAEARKLLASNGWATGTDGVLQKSANKKTERLQLTISTIDTPDLVKTANLVQKMWQDLGASVDIKIYEAADLNQNVIQPRKYDALLFGEIIPPGLDVYSFWDSAERNAPGLNIALYTNSRVDKLLEAARAASDPATTVTNYQKFETEIDKDVPAVFLYTPDFIYVVPKALGGFEVGNITNSSDRFLGIENWYLEKERVWKIFNK